LLAESYPGGPTAKVKSEMLKSLEKVVNHDPSEPRFRLWLAQADYWAGDFEGARRQAARAAEYDDQLAPRTSRRLTEREREQVRQLQTKSFRR
jgi:hypothetical protein